MASIFDTELAQAKDRAQWADTSSARILSIATAHDEIAAAEVAAGRVDGAASQMRWAACARLEIARRGDLTPTDAFAWATVCDDAMQVALVRRFGKRAVEARYDYATQQTEHCDVRWAMQAKLLADEGMRAAQPCNRAAEAA